MREKPTWANVEWLEQNVLAGQGTVSGCQRKTKAWRLVAEAVGPACQVRRVFHTDAGRLAAWVSGTSAVAMPYTGLGKVEGVAEGLHLLREVANVSVPLFTSDPATGDWDALVLFERRAK